MRITLLSVLLLTLSAPAYAYIGPGLGLGTIGIAVGLVVSLFLALFAVIWYPAKRIYRKFRPKQSPKTENPSRDPEQSG